MKMISADIPLGIGDLFYAKALFDNALKNGFDKINIGLATHLIEGYRAENKDNYYKFISDLAKLLFSSSEYNLSLKESFGFKTIDEIISEYQLSILKPKLSNILCHEKKPYNFEYIVLTTKVRQLDKKIFSYNNVKTLFSILNSISFKYKLIILGERDIEMNPEYLHYGHNNIYSIYNIIMSNINRNNIIDLTIPALGMTVSSIDDFKKDCNIMHHAKYVINFGIGGNFAMATSVGFPICYRVDNNNLANYLFNNKLYNDCFVTRDWNSFINKLASI